MDVRHIGFQAKLEKTVRLTGKSLQLAPDALESFLDGAVLESSQRYSGTSHWSLEIDRGKNCWQYGKWQLLQSQVFAGFFVS